MANTFSLILVIVTLITGVVWLLEKLVWAKKRQQKVAEIESQTVNGLDAQTLAKAKMQLGGWKTVSLSSQLSPLFWCYARLSMNRFRSLQAQ